MVAVDDESRQFADMACVARQRGVKLSVVVDVNVGLNRCGVQPGEPACRLAKVALQQGLRFRGLMGYEGHLQALPPGEERDDWCAQVGKSLVDPRKLIEARRNPGARLSPLGAPAPMPRPAHTRESPKSRQALTC